MPNFQTPPLPYDYQALEPYIDEATMRVHHDKHHVGYTTKLNKALEKYPKLTEQSAENILKNIEAVPEDIRTAVKNNGGGHVHHSFFWQIMAPQGQGGQPEGELLEAINQTFGNLENFKQQFSEAATGIFGSGWAWLSVDGGKLIIETTANQDSPYSLGHSPILAIDVWEHAYYLKYQNQRGEFVANFWEIINWKEVAKKYQASKQ